MHFNYVFQVLVFHLTTLQTNTQNNLGFSHALPAAHADPLWPYLQILAEPLPNKIVGLPRHFPETGKVRLLLTF